MFIAGIDAGRSFTKYKYEGGQGIFPSKIVPFYDHGGESPLKEAHDMIMEVRSEGETESQKYFVGEITEFVEYGGAQVQRLEQDKATIPFKMFVLNALYRMGVHDFVPCVIGTGVPYQMFKTQKDQIKQLLERHHTVKVTTIYGEETRIIKIERAIVTAEGLGVFYDNPTDEDIGIVDLGSVTGNKIRLKKKRVMTGYSGTTTWGWDNLPEDISKKPDQVAHMVIADLKARQWPKDLKIRLAGGKMGPIEAYIQAEFPNAYVVEDPQFANVRGFYKVAKTKAKQLI